MLFFFFIPKNDIRYKVLGSTHRKYTYKGGCGSKIFQQIFFYVSVLTQNICTFISIFILCQKYNWSEQSTYITYLVRCANCLLFSNHHICTSTKIFNDVINQKMTLAVWANFHIEFGLVLTFLEFFGPIEADNLLLGCLLFSKYDVHTHDIYKFSSYS